MENIIEKREVLVIEETDRKHNSEIIGVADNLIKAKAMMQEYYGEFEILRFKDIRDSGIDSVYRISVKDSCLITLRKRAEYTVTLLSFQINVV